MSRNNMLLEKCLGKLQKSIPVNVAEAIALHFDGRGRVWPTAEDGLLWMITEVAESFELISARKNYVRNNPDSKEPFSKERFAEELGDVIYMAIITGLVEGVNPLDAMFRKMENQIKKEIGNLEE